MEPGVSEAPPPIQEKDAPKRSPGGRRIRLLIDGLHSKSGGGVTYLRNMLPLLADDEGIDLHLCIQDDQRHLLPANAEKITLHVLPFHFSFWRLHFWEQFSLPRLARRIGANVTFSPANYGPFFAPNPIILIGNAISVALVERRPTKLIYWAAVYLGTVLSLIRCRRVLAVSDYARRSVADTLPRRFRRETTVVHHGVDPLFRPPAADRERENFLLAVSDVYVQKNLGNLLLAIARLRPYHPDVSLKIAGRFIDKDYLASLRQIMDAHGLAPHVEFLGHVEPQGLVELYQRCRIFVFPSLVETFGIPLIEAMACGAPIASSNTAAMPEVLGDAGLYFDPTDVDGIAVAINRLIRDPALRREFSDRARTRAAGFSWETAAARTLAVIRNAAP